jgi:multidrug resistance protein MdtO
LLAADAQAALGALSQDLGIVHYEPSSIRPSRKWITSRNQIMKDIEGLMGPLFLNVERSPALSTDIARRLECFANDIDPASDFRPHEKNVAPLDNGASSKTDAPPLRELIDTRLQDLEIAVAQSTSEQHQAAYHVPV